MLALAINTYANALQHTVGTPPKSSTGEICPSIKMALEGNDHFYLGDDIL